MTDNGNGNKSMVKRDVMERVCNILKLERCVDYGVKLLQHTLTLKNATFPEFNGRKYLKQVLMQLFPFPIDCFHCNHALKTQDLINQTKL